ncbi:hypothetical protein TraAM80_00781 [Trypanosoma rangeli]|uniref:Uncharacterized protein n=1 Tax=Trypanosoma rangeli TaxID=5698 RepID=A0A3R7LCL2_TRYRA|nr:uncharacterized protein TraAM80_00781 [Trypanosoma rangeli]RNF11697.1 hypothetical protein TraAM80_00781 [Trypanosoma rangeli]|eukprot:RNF11697.1 hypothetical protein TraAM80_00781 [Trypanosoma rangeli]
MTTAADPVLFYAKVAKIGTDGSTLDRNVYVTSSALLVCLPAGGITRTVSLASVLELEVAKADMAGKPRCTIHVSGESLLVLSFAHQNEADDFAEAVSTAASNVRVVHVAGTPVRAKHVKLDVQQAVPRGVRFVDPPALPEPSSSFASSLAAVNNKRHQLSSSTSSVGPGSSASAQTFAKPSEALDMVGRRPAVGLTANSTFGNIENSKAPPEGHVSSFCREKFYDPQQGGSQDGSGTSTGADDLKHPTGSSLYTSNITRLMTTPHGKTSGHNISLSQEDEDHEATQNVAAALHAQRDSPANLKLRLSTDLELQKQTVSRLNSELQEKNAFIDDLKTALRSQEAVFQEMIRSTEQQRLMERAKNELEKQVLVLQAEVKHWENLSKHRESEYRKELATKLAELHESHTKEVEAVQEAFAHYDAEMTEYVSSLLKDIEREACSWGKQERVLQRQIEIQQQEISELTGALASRRVVVPDPITSTSAVAADEAKKDTGGAADGLDGDGKVSPLPRGHETVRISQRPIPSALTMPALEQRLASLEEGRARLRLGEKLRRYAHRRSYETAGVCFGGGETREGQHERDRLKAEVGVGVSSLLVSAGESRTVRSRAIL